MGRMIRVFVLAIGLAACIGLSSSAQQFDMQAYKDFLASHQSMSGDEVLVEYPSVLFQKNAATQPGQVAWLDSVIIKYGLTPEEQDLLLTNGFMVTERNRAPHMIKVFSDVWHYDLPVFISSDAILHAMHMSYDEILKATEKRVLNTLFIEAMQNVADYMPQLHSSYASNEKMLPMLKDVDVFTSVCLALLGQDAEPHYPANTATIQDLLALVDAKQAVNVKLFSTTPRKYDFSQFTVRGHYEGDPVLEKYFKAFMWMGRTEFMLSKPVQQGVMEQTDADIQRMTIDSYLLREAVSKSGAEEQFEKIETFLSFLIGSSDNITMAHLDELRMDAAISSPVDLLDMTNLERFQSILESKPFASQQINSQILMSDPMDPEQLEPPSAFLLMGQRFILDSYIFGSVVYDKIMHDGEKVRRMLPSSMDVLFALGNNASAQFLQDEFQEYHYAPYLTALRYLIDDYGEEYWNNSMYSMWLNSIRTLNPPDDLEELPEFMNTAAWWQQKMNTQLASWSQLRHDNILYAKQSYSGGVSCSYPEGYVEPFPELYRRLALFGDAGDKLYSSFGAEFGLDDMAAYFVSFSEIMRRLQGIAERELEGMQLTQTDIDFMQTMLKTVQGCGDPGIIDGWYPELFFAANSTHDNLTTADVHTAPTDEVGNPVGWVLHVGTGWINIGVVIAPSVNGGQTAYTGPMMSYHEHVTVGFKRMTDSEWKEQMRANAFGRPEWTHAYLADSKGGIKPAGPMLRTAAATGVDRPLPVSSEEFQLHPAYPNPASASQEILLGFSVNSSKNQSLTLSIYDVNGKRVKTIVEQDVPSGSYCARWNADDASGNPVPAGVYLAKLQGNSSVKVQRVIITK
jgi:uncharacterized protein DUF3160/flagellar hook capping protein FlgD